MTANIQNSLHSLISAVSELEEKSITTYKKRQNISSEKNISGGKADLFSFPDSGTEENNQALASRLDGAIAKVEKLLQEA